MAHREFELERVTKFFNADYAEQMTNPLQPNAYLIDLKHRKTSHHKSLTNYHNAFCKSWNLEAPCLSALLTRLVRNRIRCRRETWVIIQFGHFSIDREETVLFAKARPD